MNNKSKCFISYCHSDTNASEVDYLVSLLKERMKKSTEFLYDEDLKIGKTFKAFMDMLNQVDIVILLSSPFYKERLHNRKTGVGYEYNLILERYNKVLKEKKETENEFLSERTTNYFEVLPVVIKGDFYSSIPENFADNKGIDMSYLKVIKKKRGSSIEFTVPKNIKTKFDKDIERIISEIRSSNRIKQPGYEKRLKDNYSRLNLDVLFKNTSADFKNDKYSGLEIIDTLFVRTHVYKQIEQQSSYYIIGRKGSGKSALTQVLPLRNANQYFSVIDIYANRDFYMNILFSFLEPEFKSDSSSVFSRIDCFKHSWALFFRICLLDSIIQQSKNNNLTELQTKQINRINKFIKGIKTIDHDNNDVTKRGYFVYSFQSIIRFMKDCISKARKDDEYFLSDITLGFSLNNYLVFALGKDILRDLREFCEYLPKRFLITFDGFDTEIEKFREESAYFENKSFQEKVAFEIDWLHSLILLVNNVKQMGNNLDVVMDKLDFCITIPNHRFLEIERQDIDSYKLQHKRKMLIWSGLELALFLRKRLELLSGYRIKKKTPKDTLEEIMKAKYSHIPDPVIFTFNNNEIRMPLFLYVLRHTFWRPRDILLYYAHIITLCDDAKDNGYEVSMDTLRTNIANLTFEIIKDDFKNEYKNTVRNFTEIIEAFNKSNQILSFQEVEERITSIAFDYAVVPNDEIRSSILHKIKFLYATGFLGIKADKEMKDKFNLFSNDSFIFNESGKILKKVNKERLKDFQYIIHPLFCEYLEIVTTDNDFIMEYTWKYLEAQESLVRSSNEDFECF